jgi:hypothetical protein
LLSAAWPFLISVTDKDKRHSQHSTAHGFFTEFLIFRILNKGHARKERQRKREKLKIEISNFQIPNFELISNFTGTQNEN